MSDSSGGPESRAGELLRRIAQLVAFTEDATPEIRVGDLEELAALESALPRGIPSALRTMYSESDPVSLTVPLAGEDLDFIPLQDVAEVLEEESIGDQFIPFARAGKTLLCVATTSHAGGSEQAVVALSRSGTIWEEEPAGAGLDRFLTVLAEILYRLGSRTGNGPAATVAAEDTGPAFSVEVAPEALVAIESVIDKIDPQHADFWMSLLS